MSTKRSCFMKKYYCICFSVIKKNNNLMVLCCLRSEKVQDTFLQEKYCVSIWNLCCETHKSPTVGTSLIQWLLIEKTFMCRKLLILRVLVINPDMKHVPILSLSHHNVFSSPLFFPFLIPLNISYLKESNNALGCTPGNLLCREN